LFFGCIRLAIVDAADILTEYLQMCKTNTVTESSSNPQSSLPMSERMFLRAKDAADLLSISKSHFHLLVRDGVLPPGKLISGAVRVFKREELEEAAEQMWEGS
jgi:excisionase family DNA binding protein